MRKVKLLNLLILVFGVLAHVLCVALSFLIYRYSKIDVSIFFSVIGIIVAVLILSDVLLLFGFNLNDKILQSITLVLFAVFTIAGGGGSFYLYRTNKAIDNIVDQQATEGIIEEEIRIKLVVRKDSNIKSIDDLTSKSVGVLFSNEEGTGSVGKRYFENNGVSPIYTDFNITSDLFLALVEGNIDCAVLSNTYRSMMSSEDGMEEYFDELVEIASYTENVQYKNDMVVNKDITTEPFTVLLIGFAPEEGGGGLTDTIIVASVDPVGPKVTMTSIPRDSYVEIAGWNGAKSKINDAGAQSTNCLMNTVSNLMGIDIDYYMRVNFQGLVDIVDALGGIMIDSPVEFIGQSPSTRRGEMYVYVPAGPYNANGEQALAFARERHAMPNGDFDRAIHQQEVISAIAGKLFELRDVNSAVKVLETAGENFSTNFTVDQMTSLFSYFLKLPNYTRFSKFNTITIEQTRLTGYSSWHYHMGMKLPLWIYPLYNGSIEENANLHKNTLRENNITQNYGFKFFLEWPYYQPELYSLYFNEKEVHEDMPNFYTMLTSMTYEEALAWAKNKGVKLTVVPILPGDSGYDESRVGSIVDQSVKYGQLCADFPTCTIWLMGPLPLAEEDMVPDFTNESISTVRKWTNENNIRLIIKYLQNNDVNLAGIVYNQSAEPKSDKNEIEELEVSVYDYPEISEHELRALTKGMNETDLKNWVNKNLFFEPNYVYSESSSEDCGTLDSWSSSADKPTMGSMFTFVISANHKWSEVEGSRVEPSEEAAGSYKEVCANCGEERTIEIPVVVVNEE